MPNLQNGISLLGWKLQNGIPFYPSPVASFDFQELENELPATIQFNDRSTEDAIEFGWDFGDGKQSTEESPYR